jgi:cysteine-S-conjugate beta-lyase
MKNATRCVYLDPNDQFGSISPPIYQTATFRQPTADEFGEYDYSRTANPTRSQLEAKLADLEHGRHAATFASGMAAISAVCRLVESGDEIIAGDDLYGGTVRLLQKILPRHGISVVYVNITDLGAVREAISEKTKLILIETPTNPLLRVADIAALAEIAHANGALLAVDNTMLSPCLQNPLRLGADIVIHSATKFLCGHSDVTAGAVVTKDEEIHQRIAFIQNAEGAGLSPFDSWLLLRGIKTLALRVERQNSTALEVAKFLSVHPQIENVYYPALPGHSGHEINLKQASGGGAVVSFTTGDAGFSRRIAEATRLFSIAVSFGSVNSSISLPCRMSHASIPEALRDKLAPPSDLIRISVGIEDVDDLLDDLDAAISIAAEAEQKFNDSIAPKWAAAAAQVA